ncbi:4a-hydroxytetrahydrobiopterin dehydratase [Streptomyces sp. NBC_00322]|uniref:hypothetical protein n=1 Tax=Streptomyces sp. NBC_00322 TaxID=2975712 RepID=UPI002E2B3E6D|nr:hypothetical protein [Streptomyces sp. NBC_00322]
MAGVPKPLTDGEIEARLAKLPEWTRDGDERGGLVRCPSQPAVGGRPPVPAT